MLLHNFVLTNYAEHRIRVIIPNYLPGCNKLALNINNIITKTHPNVNIICKDLADFMVNTLQKQKEWTAFITPLSSGAPGRDAIKNQYFSSISNDSWTGVYQKPEELYYLIGIGQTLITVDGKRFCNIKANQLGISNFIYSDLITCN